MDLLIAKQQTNPVEYYVEAYAQHPDKPGIFALIAAQLAVTV